MSAFEWLRKIVAGNRMPLQRDPVTYKPVGVVRNRVSAPQAAGWEGVRSDIILAPELEAGLDELDGFSHVIVVFDFHAIPDDAPRPQKHRIGPREVGVFATRHQLRPNTIGVGVARIVLRRKNVLRVRGLDAINGTPVLDIKPYLPPYDSVPDASLPAWAVDDS